MSWECVDWGIETGEQDGVFCVQKMDASTFFSTSEHSKDTKPEKRKSQALKAKKPKKSKAPQETKAPEPEAEIGFSSSAWNMFGLCSDLIRALEHKKFTVPTPIQKLCLSAAIQHHKQNIVAAAETGSGKTLAFGLPILDRWAFREEKRDEGAQDEENKLFSLILTPTRELAIQVADHLKSAAQFLSGIQIAVLVGGMSAQKQQRILSYKPDIVVATPGRLWDFIDNVALARFRVV